MSNEKTVKFVEWHQYPKGADNKPDKTQKPIKSGLKYLVGSDPQVDQWLAEGRDMQKTLTKHNKAIAAYMADNIGAGELRLYFTPNGDCNVYEPEARQPRKAGKPVVAADPTAYFKSMSSAPVATQPSKLIKKAS